MKHSFVISIFLITILGLSTCSFSKKINLKNIPSKKKINKYARNLQEYDSSSAEPNMTISNNYSPKSSSGMSAGTICAIAIPCIAALIGIGVASAILCGSSPKPIPKVMPIENINESTIAKFPVPKEIQVQPPVIPHEIVQPPVELPPQPVQPIIKPIYPMYPTNNNIINVPQQPVVYAQPQMIPVQQVQMVPVQQVQMVPVQEIVPTYQTAQVAPQVTQISEIPSVTTQVQGTQINQSGQGLEGGDFATAPEGYGTSAL